MDDVVDPDKNQTLICTTNWEPKITLENAIHGDQIIIYSHQKGSDKDLNLSRPVS